MSFDTNTIRSASISCYWIDRKTGTLSGLFVVRLETGRMTELLLLAGIGVPMAVFFAVLMGIVPVEEE